MDDLPYTTTDPRVSAAPDHCFESMGYYIASVDTDGGLRNLTDWMVPYARILEQALFAFF